MSERLTEKDGKYYRIAEPYINWTNGVQRVVKKLGQLEDIEQELGIDLITFVKLNKTSEIYDKEEETSMFFNWIDLENKCLVCEDDFDEMSGGYLHFYYYFKDYGKKWALTKEELK